VKAYATLRFAGDELEPREISDLLGVAPTRAYRKGECYFAGPRTGEFTGRTGIWLLSTEKVVSDSDLGRHLSYLMKLIFEGEPDRAAALRRLLARRDVKAHVLVLLARQGRRSDTPGSSLGDRGIRTTARRNRNRFRHRLRIPSTCGLRRLGNFR
jgi:hypothetical protein